MALGRCEACEPTAAGAFFLRGGARAGGPEALTAPMLLPSLVPAIDLAHAPARERLARGKWADDDAPAAAEVEPARDGGE
jgi:hypothetical protein